MGDGNDHLETLICPVLITADHLRAFRREEREALAARLEDRASGVGRLPHGGGSKEDAAIALEADRMLRQLLLREAAGLRTLLEGE